MRLEKMEFFALPAAHATGREAGLSRSRGMKNPVSAGGALTRPGSRRPRV